MQGVDGRLDDEVGRLPISHHPRDVVGDRPADIPLEQVPLDPPALADLGPVPSVEITHPSNDAPDEHHGDGAQKRRRGKPGEQRRAGVRRVQQIGDRHGRHTGEHPRQRPMPRGQHDRHERQHPGVRVERVLQRPVEEDVDQPGRGRHQPGSDTSAGVEPGRCRIPLVVGAHPMHVVSHGGGLRDETAANYNVPARPKCSRCRPHSPCLRNDHEVRQNQTRSLIRRGVAQPGSAPALGAGGPRFEPGRPDHLPRRTPRLVGLERQRPPAGGRIELPRILYVDHDTPFGL